MDVDSGLLLKQVGKVTRAAGGDLLGVECLNGDRHVGLVVLDARGIDGDTYRFGLHGEADRAWCEAK